MEGICMETIIFGGYKIYCDLLLGHKNSHNAHFETYLLAWGY